MNGQRYTSGAWHVSPGQADDFIARWTEFTTWAHSEAPGARMFLLLRAADAPDEFVSYGAWDSDESVAAWKAQPEFGRYFTRCRELCDEFSGVDYTLASSVNLMVTS
ncbi:hypothetical protein [Alloactinosynnema sp. L-07]|uniref:putative quinol monooxygenase n=1 Tax=Alloactinosynnema sp. L-07 TaxID=1653480 RepID=UPI00065EFE07|nr:antibiotic biosynthesis monooxygenase family protein [Alloactinosynnema sp. L-07]CRK55018.1 hypothetical protein [Alloactinosynnema sp. L-07]